MSNVRKLSLDELRALISELHARGIPEFVIREQTKKFVDGLKAHIQRHISMTRTDEESTQRAFDIANEALERLEDKIVDVVEETIWQFVYET